MDYIEIYQKEHVENGLSYSQIREKYGIPRGTWNYYVRELGKMSCDSRKYRAIDDFFSNIDSEIKAYLLGFLYADGYISKDGRIGCLLQEDDVEMLELMRKYIVPTGKIKYINYQNFKRKPQVKLRWHSKQMLQDLMRYGFTTDKTHIDAPILSFIPDEHKPAFIRGYCDGDGTIRFQLCKNQNWYRCAVYFVNGCPKILEDIQEYFKKYGCEGTFKSYKNYYTLSYEKVKDAFIIAKTLYENANYYLTRKYEHAIQMINFRTNTELTRHHKRFLEV